MGRYAASHLAWLVEGHGFHCIQTGTTCGQALASGARLIGDKLPKALALALNVRARQATAEETRAFIVSETAGGHEFPAGSLLIRQANGELPRPRA